MIPVPAWMGGRGGRPEGYCHREMIDAVRYVVDNGIKWRALPSDFPSWQAVYRFFRRWRDQGLLTVWHDRLRRACRVREGREPEPTAGVVDSQSLRGAETVSADAARLRRGQARERHQTAHRRGHARAAADGAGHRRRGAGPRRGDAAAEAPARGLPAHRAGMGRRRLRRGAGRLVRAAPARAAPDRSSSAATPPKGSWSCTAAGAWNAPCRGSPPGGGACGTTNAATTPHEAMVRWAMTLVMTRRLARPAPALSRAVQPALSRPAA